MNKTIESYNESQAENNRLICDTLAKIIDAALAGAESKVWHGAPVWFVDGNPIVGYSKLKDNVQLLFWSGQSFGEPGLKAEGKFKAAEARYASVDQIDEALLTRWLQESLEIKWDYKNIVKNRGVLNRI